METSTLVRRAVVAGRRNTAMSGRSAVSSRRGEGYEFAELRAYVHGDDPRRIDWAATARAGEMQTRVMLEEHALVFLTVIDEAPSMRLGRERSRLDAARDAAALWNAALRAGDRCLAVGEDDCFEARGAGIEVAGRACAAHAFGTRDVDAALRRADAVAPRGSALLVVSDGWAAIEDERLHRVASRHDPTFLLARDPWHAGLPLRGFARLRDASGRDARFLVRPRDAARYAEAVARREAAFRARFEDAGWRFGLLDEDANRALRDVFAHPLAPQGGPT